jgi:3-isopropylmalate dehydratase small subunit
MGEDVAKPRADFVLNKPGYEKSSILIAGDNFGCGSSREHAPWSINDMGIRCIISTSFADIFYNNCINNGMLPVTLPRDQVEKLLKDAEVPGTEITVDLVNSKVSMVCCFMLYILDLLTNSNTCLLVYSSHPTGDSFQRRRIPI